MVMDEGDIGAGHAVRADPAEEGAGMAAGGFPVGWLDSQAGERPKETRRPMIGARMGKDPPEESQVDKPGGKDSGSERSNGEAKTRPRGGRSSNAFDLWLQRELQDMFADVSREPVPDELMRLIDESKAKK